MSKKIIYCMYAILIYKCCVVGVLESYILSTLYTAATEGERCCCAREPVSEGSAGGGEEREGE